MSLNVRYDVVVSESLVLLAAMGQGVAAAVSNIFEVLSLADQAIQAAGRRLRVLTLNVHPDEQQHFHAALEALGFQPTRGSGHLLDQNGTAHPYEQLLEHLGGGFMGLRWQEGRLEALIYEAMPEVLEAAREAAADYVVRALEARLAAGQLEDGPPSPDAVAAVRIPTSAGPLSTQLRFHRLQHKLQLEADVENPQGGPACVEAVNYLNALFGQPVAKQEKPEYRRVSKSRVEVCGGSQQPQQLAPLRNRQRQKRSGRD